MTGENEMVPCIRNDFSLEDWQAVGHILLKGCNGLNYFPISLTKTFVIVAFYGEHMISDSELLESFFRSIPYPDALLLKKVIKSGFT